MNAIGKFSVSIALMLGASSAFGAGGGTNSPAGGGGNPAGGSNTGSSSPHYSGGNTAGTGTSSLTQPPSVPEPCGRHCDWFPHPWTVAGTAPDHYSFGPDTTGAITIRAKASATPSEFSTLFRRFSANSYRGKRIRLTAMLRPWQIEDGAGMWCRVDDAQGNAVAFDNMQSRLIIGSRNWSRYDIVLDVPPQADVIGFGFLVVGQGSLSLQQFRLDEVPLTVPTTDTLAAAKSGDALPNVSSSDKR